MALVYRRPDVPPLRLPSTPLLESWNSNTDPAQVRLASYVDEVAGLVSLPDTADHLALHLRVGLPLSRPLITGGGDLDNYLFPIVRRLGANRFDAVFGAKAHDKDSWIAVAPRRRATPSNPRT